MDTRIFLIFIKATSFRQGQKLEEGKWPQPPHTFSFTKKWPVLLRADSILTKDPTWPYDGQFCGKIDREGSCSKAAGGPS